MNGIRLEVDGPTNLEPRGEVGGKVHWTLSSTPESIHIRLFWYTEGRGDRDLSVVEEVVTNVSAGTGSSSFRFQLPAGPYSFSGHLISLIWAIEAVAEPGGESARAEIVIGPDGNEARIDGGPAPAD